MYSTLRETAHVPNMFRLRDLCNTGLSAVPNHQHPHCTFLFKIMNWHGKQFSQKELHGLSSQEL
jgi:hypothetical protein